MITTIETTKGTFHLDYKHVINRHKLDTFNEDLEMSKVISIKRRLRNYNINFENGLTFKIPNHQVVKTIIL